MTEFKMEQAKNTFNEIRIWSANISDQLFSDMS